MALDPERKVKTGDRLAIPASTYNSLIDMLREYKRKKGRFGAGVPASTILPHNTVLVQNQTGINLTDSFKILRIADVITSVQDNLHEFSRRPAFVGTIPQNETDAICITIDPALVNGVGSGYEIGSGSGATADIVPAVISGITLALVHLVNVDDEWANPTPGSVDYLTSGSSGQARILYWESLTGSFDISGSGSDDVVIAVVNLIGAVSSGSAPTCQFCADYNTLNSELTVHDATGVSHPNILFTGTAGSLSFTQAFPETEMRMPNTPNRFRITARISALAQLVHWGAGLNKFVVEASIWGFEQGVSSSQFQLTDWVKVCRGAISSTGWAYVSSGGGSITLYSLAEGDLSPLQANLLAPAASSAWEINQSTIPTVLFQGLKQNFEVFIGTEGSPLPGTGNPIILYLALKFTAVYNEWPGYILDRGLTESSVSANVTINGDPILTSMRIPKYIATSTFNTSAFQAKIGFLAWGEFSGLECTIACPQDICDPIGSSISGVA